MNLPPGFSVGPVTVNPPLLLAPMEDVSALPMRLIAKRIAGPGLMFTEFVSAMALHYQAKKTYKKLIVHPDERPLAIQIFGGEPDKMADAARICEDHGADIVDINMGCWVPKVCRTGSGAALLKDPDTAEAIVRAVVKAVRIPVTVKVRAGWDYSLFAAPDLARRFQDAGAQMLTLHARFAKQGFEGQADWDLIKQMRETVTVPLIGNGDVKTPADAQRMLQETGCDGVMVGRAAISNPWALAKISAALTGQPEPSDPTLDDRIAVALEHAHRMICYEAGLEQPVLHLHAPDIRPETDLDTERRAMRALRGQLPLYIKGVHGASHLRGSLSTVDTYHQLREILLTFRETAEERIPETVG